VLHGNALQILIDGKWEYVFCRSGGKVVTTKDRRKALPALDLEWFQNRFGNDTFRKEVR